MRVPLALSLLGLVALADTSPGACEDAWPAPADFAVEIKDGFTDYVSITWTPDQAVHDGVNFSNYRVERRDDTAGGPFVTIYTSTFRYSGLTTQGIADPAHDPACTSANGCVEPGHTYTYRMFAQFTYAVGCPLNDGDVHDSASSATATLVVPGGSAGGAPTNVLAIGDTKKPRVTVTWTAPATKPDRYVIKRRRVSEGPAKGPKETEAFKEVGTAKDVAKLFVDKDVDPDETYEYVVEAILAGVPAQSVVDRAFSVSGRCPKSDFKLWDGTFRFDSGSRQHEIQFYEGSDHPGSMGCALYRIYGNGMLPEDGLDIRFDGDEPRTGGSVEVDAGVESVNRAEADPLAWGSGIDSTTKGSLFLEYLRATPFDPIAFRRVKGKLVTRSPGRPRETREFEADRVFSGSPDTGPFPAKSTLCATFAAGTAKAVPPGAEVVFVYQLVNVGPSPLFSRRANVKFIVTNRVLLEAVGGMFSGPADVDGLTSATFAVGALGPKSQTKSEVASIVLRVRVGTPDGKAQLAVNAELVDLPVAPYSAQQELTFAHALRTVELPIAVPAKR